MVAKQLFTIGYEGSDLTDFLATLSLCDISQVIDVRDVPVSRKKGFSKNLLREALRLRGIAYLHLKDLGDPKPGRDAARRGDFAEFRKIYFHHIKKAEAQAALEIAKKSASIRTSCLLCFERANENCHRSIVADRLAEGERFIVRHIGVRVGAGTHRKIANGQITRELALG